MDNQEAAEVFIEFYKRTLREVYGGNLQKMKDAGHFILWTPERIKNSFSNGNGTMADLLAYIKNNREFCIFENVPQARKGGRTSQAAGRN